MKKIAIVVHRYDKSIGSGAEDLAMKYANKLSPCYQVEILTTTCLDAQTWANALPAGMSTIDGITVHRFPTVHGRILDEFSRLSCIQADRITRGEPTENEDDQQWVETQGPDCPALLAYLAEHHEQYSAFLFMTYIYYPSIRGIPLVAEKSIFFPTAHDEIWIRQELFRDLFHAPSCFGFLTGEEEKFVRSYFHNDYIPGMIIGSGIDMPEEMDSKRFRRKFNINGDYLVYVGRIEAAKNCDELIQNFIAYKDKHPSELKLVLVGRGGLALPVRRDVLATGFISEQEKWDAISGAKVMVAPSSAESLCIALLEGLSAGIPALVNGNCAVLKEHCIKGSCGYFYRNEVEFERALKKLLEMVDERAQLRENALAYVAQNYCWETAAARLRMIIEFVAAGGKGEFKKVFEGQSVRSLTQAPKRAILSDNQLEAVIIHADPDTALEQVFSDAVTALFVASDSFVNYLGVLLNSVIMNASPDRNYDLVIMQTDMTVKNMNLLHSLTLGRSNIRIRFVDVNHLVDPKMLIVTGKNYNHFTFYRLLLPHLMRQYQKVLYLDADMLANADIAELYDLDVTGFDMAGTYDITVTSWQSYSNKMQSYFRSIGLTKPGNYMQAGVILFNVEEMNRNYTPRFLLEKACTEQYLLNDQDLLNVYSKGRIKFFGVEWNVFVLSEMAAIENQERLPERFYKEYTTARRNPKMIHYTEKQFPDRVPDSDMGALYWNYARNTPFYERLLRGGAQ